MKFHYMARSADLSVDELKKISNELDKNGYYSILLTYHSKAHDYLLKTILAANNDINLKFMIAIRTYAISPEYLAMMCASYNDLFPNKIIFNIVSGDIHKGETSVEDLVMFSSQLSTPEQRLPYTEEWLEKFLNISKKWYTPEIFLAGNSEKTRSICNRFNFSHISALNMYLDYIKKDNRVVNKMQTLSFSILIRDTDEEAEEFLKNNHEPGAEDWTIFGSPETIRQRLLDIKNLGITDCLIFKSKNDTQYYRVNNLIKEFMI